MFIGTQTGATDAGEVVLKPPSVAEGDEKPDFLAEFRHIYINVGGSG